MLGPLTSLARLNTVGHVEADGKTISRSATKKNLPFGSLSLGFSHPSQALALAIGLSDVV
jgi:hypothetical protein